MSIKRIAQQARKFLLAGSAMLAVFVLAPQALADGTETLGPPSIAIETGSDVIVAGTGTLAQPADININIPAGATVKQVLLYWEGRDTNASGGDADISVNGNPVNGDIIGGPNLWTSGGGNFGYSYTFRADITGLGLVTDGANVLTIDDMAFTNVTNGAGAMVIIDDGGDLAEIQIRDGNDTAFFKWAPPLDTTAPQTFTFAASPEARNATLLMFASAVSGTNSGTGGDFRPTAIDVTVDGTVTTFNNLLNSNDGQEWDTFDVSVNIPAGVTELTVQLFSDDRVPIGGLPASLSWNAAGLAITEIPQIKLLKEVSINGIDFFPADDPADPDVPVGIVGLTDATYRLIVTNTGSETLTNVLIEDPTLSISTLIADLAPGESRIINAGDAGFGNLFVPMRCGGTTGNKANTATVTADGAISGIPVTDSNPANVRCITGPEIELIKQVSLTGGAPFFDADTEATGPTGPLGSDATYRLIVRNVGDEDLTNVLVEDATLGISTVIADLPVGGEVVIDAGPIGDPFENLFQPNRCDVPGPKVNTAEVHADGVITGLPVEDMNPAYVNCEAEVCDISVDKTCVIAPPPGGDNLCESAIAATTLRYTGPSIDNATVTFMGRDDGYAEYVGVDLVSNVTILTSAGQNNYTIDATLTGEKLGSKTTIFIDGVEEIIHTSCSAIYEAGLPAPLDANTPNPPNSEKGDPSPNWEVVNFLDKDGGFVEESPGAGGPGQDACTVPYGGADVTYEYLVTNNGASSVDITSVLDNQLGELLISPPEKLASGGTLELSSGPWFIGQLTENTVEVTANTTGQVGAQCMAEDTVIVDVEPPPELSCDDGKPVELVFEYTGQACEANPANDQDGKFTCSGDPAGAAPVQLVVEDADANPAGQSINVGDLVSIMPSGDKFDAQTDFEIMQGGQTIQDLSIHLSCSQPINVGDRFGSLTLRVFVPGTGGKKKTKDK